MPTVTKTIGSSGRDYATITLWEADLDDGGIYAAGDDAVGEMYNDSVFDEIVVINGGSTIGLTSIKLTAANGEQHDGTAGSGARIVPTSSATWVIQTVNGFTDLTWIELDGNGNTYRCVGSKGRYYQNLICHGAYGTSYLSSVYCMFADNTVIRMSNCIAYNAEHTHANGLASCIYGQNSFNIYNCTAFSARNTSGSGGLVVGIYASLGKPNNTISMGHSSAGTVYDFYNVNSNTTYCMSEDTTATDGGGTGCLSGYDPNNIFVSTISGSEDLSLIVDSAATDVGQDITGVITDIENDLYGTDRTLTGRWSMGAYEGPKTITKTIGTSGRDYSTITLWEADLDSTSIYIVGDNAVGEMYNDSDFSEQPTINGGGTIGLGSITLRAAEGERHDGTAGTGVRMLASVNLSCRLVVNNDTNGLVTIEGIEIDANGTRQDVLIAGGFGANGNGRIHRCLLHGGIGWAQGVVLTSFNEGAYSVVSNCIIYNHNRTFNTPSPFTKAALYLQYRGPFAYNNTVHDITSNTGDAVGFGTSYVVTETIISNNLVTGSDGVDFDFSTYSPTPSYNASSDATATGTGSLTNVVTADQYVSTVSGSEDLHLKIGATVTGAGADVSAVTINNKFDINGTDRTLTGRWSIGAHEGPKVITKTIGTTGRDYSTITLWEADLDSTSIYIVGDEAVGEMYNDSAFSEQWTIDGGGTIGLASITLTAAEGERHDGTAGTGVRFVQSTSYRCQVTTDVPVDLLWFEMDGNSTLNNNQMLVHGRSGTVNHLILHNHVTSWNSIVYTAAGHNYDMAVMNCIVYDFINTAPIGKQVLIVNQGVASGSGQIIGANLTIHGCYSTGDSPTVAYSLADNVTRTGQNILVTDCDVCFNNSSYVNSTVNHNATSDATASGTGSLTNIVTANQYVSTVSGSEDLHLKAGSDCIDAGTDLGILNNVNIDINGRDRDAEADIWDIGAHEYVSLITPISVDNIFNINTLDTIYTDKLFGVSNLHSIDYDRILNVSWRGSVGTPSKYWTLDSRDTDWIVGLRDIIWNINSRQKIIRIDER